jgi:transposase-like protein
MTMAKARKKRERDQRDGLPDTIDFKGLTQEEVLGQGGLLKQLTGRLLQKSPEAEMAGYPGYEKHGNAGNNSGNSRNGHSEKTVLTEDQEAVIQAPWDRNGTFEPEIVPKHQKRMPLFNGQIIPMYSFGMMNRDIKNHLEPVLFMDALRVNIRDGGQGNEKAGVCGADGTFGRAKRFSLPWIEQNRGGEVLDGGP